MTISKHVQAAPATSWALHHLPDVTRDGDRLGLVYLTVAALADRDLYGPDGYGSHTEHDVASVLVRINVDEIHEALQELLRLGWLEWRLSGYRIPQSAFDAANEA